MKKELKKTLIIAEAGVNHNGSLELAKRLALQAKKSGADIVKFQTLNVDALVSENAKMAEYQRTNMGKEESQKDMLRKLALSYDDFILLEKYCVEIGIKFLSTPFDLDSIDFLEKIGCNLWKIPSGEITNYPYLVKIARTNKPVILSTGMSTMEEVREAVTILKDNNSGKITLLHCTTQYPTPYEEVNLKAMISLKEEFGCSVGYSDHTQGIAVPIAATAMGAEIIEKHFTLDRNMEGPDHKASLEPAELEEMIKNIRIIDLALGDGQKKPMPSEIANKSVARKSIIASCEIKEGELLTDENLTTKRPGDGISPMQWKNIIGTKAIRDFKKDELIEVK